MYSTVEASYENQWEKIQEICEFLSHTDWVYKPPRLFIQIILSQGILECTCFAGGLEKKPQEAYL